MNVKQQKTDIAESFAESIPDIAELLYAVEQVEGVSVHTAVANLVHHNRDEAISFLNISDQEFRAAYLIANGLNDFPVPSNPPIITADATEVMNLRGGNDELANNTAG